MKEIDSTAPERKYLEQIQRFPLTKAGHLHRLAAEIVPPAIFIAFGIYREKDVYFVIAIVFLVVLNVRRLVKQRIYLKLLQSISFKLLRETNRHADDTASSQKKTRNMPNPDAPDCGCQWFERVWR